MAISFDEARTVVWNLVAATWVSEESGTLFVAESGREDARSWLVTVGPRQLIVDGDVNFSIVGMPTAMFVDKATGAASWYISLPGQPDWERVDAMTVVSNETS